MAKRDFLPLMVLSIILILGLQRLNLCYTDWLSMTLYFTGLSILLYSFRFFPEMILSSTWPNIEGIITTSKKHITKTGPTSSGVYPVVKYTYTVDGLEYVFNRIKIGVQSISSSSIDWVEGTLAKYPLDEVVQVYYNPNKPSKAVLEPGMTIRVYGFTLLGLLFYLIGQIVGYIIWYAMSLPEI